MNERLFRIDDELTVLVDSNKIDQSFSSICKLLKEELEFPEELNLNLLCLKHLSYMASLPEVLDGKDKLFLRIESKARKIVNYLESFKNEELKKNISHFSASLSDARFIYYDKKGKSLQENIKDNLQSALSNYWRSIDSIESKDELYNVRNNLANALSRVGRYTESLSLLEENQIANPERYQSFASWGDIMLEMQSTSLLPQIVSFYVALIDKYEIACKIVDSDFIKVKLVDSIEYCKIELRRLDVKFKSELIVENREMEFTEFSNQNDYRKFVLENNLSLNEHSLHCFCNNSGTDNLTVGTYSGSIHKIGMERKKKLDIYLDRLKSEFAFARILYYKYLNFNSSDGESYHYSDLCFLSDSELRLGVGYKTEHIRTSYRLLYGILDKIAVAVLFLFEVPKESRLVYFESFYDQFKEELSGCKNIHLMALYSLSSDLSQSTEANKSGSLGYLKKIRNLMEHGYLSIENNEFDLIEENMKQVDFEKTLNYLLRITRSSIFSLTYLIRTETFVRDL